MQGQCRPPAAWRTAEICNRVAAGAPAHVQEDDAGATLESSPASTPGRPAGTTSPGSGVAAAAPAGGGSGGPSAPSEPLQAAGVRLGTDLLLRLSQAVRGGADSLHAELALDPESQRVAVRRVLYRAGLLPGLRLLLAPFGARGEDAAYTLNPLAGQGLAALVRRGCPLHAARLGSLAGLAVDGNRTWGSAALFARGGAGRRRRAWRMPGVPAGSPVRRLFPCLPACSCDS